MLPKKKSNFGLILAIIFLIAVIYAAANDQTTPSYSRPVAIRYESPIRAPRVRAYLSERESGVKAEGFNKRVHKKLEQVGTLVYLGEKT